MVRLYEDSPEAIKARCERLQAEMLAWVARGDGASNPIPQAMTIGRLCEVYMTSPSSRFHQIKWNSRESYQYVIRNITDNIGDVRLIDIKMDTFFQWFNDARWPQGVDGPVEHLRKAVGIIAMLRRVVSFGVAAEIEECIRLQAILNNMRFPGAAKGSNAMTRQQMMTFVAEALKNDRLSLALGTAIQFECGFRQRDVVGEWAPIKGEPTSPYVLNGKQWQNGLTWEMIDRDFVLSKKTTKTGTVVSHDLTLMPVVMDLINRIPRERRVYGPVILNELTGGPYAFMSYSHRWREIADKAGLPASLKNKEARAGAASEAAEAGAALGDTRATLGHSSEAMTLVYTRNKGLENSRRVAKARQQLTEAK